MDCVAAIDQGTQSTRVFIFNAQAQPIASHQIALQQIHPKSGWSEHDPLKIWDSVQQCLQKAIEAAEQSVGSIRVAAVGITNQRETTLAWDAYTGQPLHNAIVWLDSRTNAICSRWKEELEGGIEYFRPITGLPISTYFSAFKFQWLHENVPAVAEAAAAGRCMFGTVDSWLIYQLTGGVDGGVHVTDVTNASRTNLMDLRTRQWHAPFLPMFHLEGVQLPRIVSNAEVYGKVAAGALKGVPIAGCLGDQMAAMLGQRCCQGEAKNTYGTGCFMLLHTGPEIIPSAHGLLTTMAFQLGQEAAPQYALEGSIAVAGYGITWLCDNLGALDSADDSEALALTVPDTGGVYFVPAFSGLLAPHWRADARGALLGLSGFTTRAHIVRAMLEAICFQTREVLDAMRADADMAGMRLLRVDGGATQNSLLMQLQADILQVPVVLPNFRETTALGAALAAGLAVGLWDEAFVRTPPMDDARCFEPQANAEAAERRYAHWHKAVQRSLDLAEFAE